MSSNIAYISIRKLENTDTLCYIFGDYGLYAVLLQKENIDGIEMWELNYVRPI